MQPLVCKAVVLKVLKYMCMNPQAVMHVLMKAGIGDIAKGKGEGRLNVALDKGRCRLFLAVCNKDSCPCRWQR